MGMCKTIQNHGICNSPLRKFQGVKGNELSCICLMNTYCIATSESRKGAGGSRIVNADGCWLLVVCVDVSIALSRGPCLISVLSPCLLLPFYLSVAVTVSVPVLGAGVIIAQDPAPALVAITAFVPAVAGIHACTRACAHDLHTASDCPACASIPSGNVESQMCL